MAAPPRPCPDAACLRVRPVVREPCGTGGLRNVRALPRNTDSCTVRPIGRCFHGVGSPAEGAAMEGLGPDRFDDRLRERIPAAVGDRSDGWLDARRGRLLGPAQRPECATRSAFRAGRYALGVRLGVSGMNCVRRNRETPANAPKRSGRECRPRRGVMPAGLPREIAGRRRQTGAEMRRPAPDRPARSDRGAPRLRRRPSFTSGFGGVLAGGHRRGRQTAPIVRRSANGMRRSAHGMRDKRDPAS